MFIWIGLTRRDIIRTEDILSKVEVDASERRCERLTLEGPRRVKIDRRSIGET